ncbi:MAG: ParA family protein [Saprospiraceae bacterium]|nr:ParA family protein [Saprospiraceae bacterium]MCF8250512.1 ParA family protein [Saprospiraceae bacterium]MCF8279652.1 ParA family protein [Bacteroidales bacterium]MCF8312438.1 ParA family protein [Saprospiraceae bacterium]MCF8440745.1 ParA family protein [Saprospiraceae bacterium]
MIISITNLKGGVGKSTLAQNLAVYLAKNGRSLCIADTDVEQQTSVKWGSVRSAIEDGSVPEVPVYLINPDTISDQILNKLGKKYDLVIIDGTPALTELTTRIIIMSDLVVTPILASATDVWALDTFLKRYEEARITKQAMGGKVELYVLLNKYNERINLDREIGEAIGDMDVNLFDTKLSTRVAYKEATVQGLGVAELRDKNAQAEIEAIAAEIEKLL